MSQTALLERPSEVSEERLEDFSELNLLEAILLFNELVAPEAEQSLLDKLNQRIQEIIRPGRREGIEIAIQLANEPPIQESPPEPEIPPAF